MGKSGKEQEKRRNTHAPPAIRGHDQGIVNAVIETPSGSRNKFKFDEKLGFYSLSGVLPEGMVFPHAFGFVPRRSKRNKRKTAKPKEMIALLEWPRTVEVTPK